MDLIITITDPETALAGMETPAPAPTEEPQGGFPWWILAVAVAAVAVLVVVMVVRRRRKRTRS